MYCVYFTIRGEICIALGHESRLQITLKRSMRQTLCQGIHVLHLCIEPGKPLREPGAQFVDLRFVFFGRGRLLGLGLSAAGVLSPATEAAEAAEATEAGRVPHA